MLKLIIFLWMTFFSYSYSLNLLTRSEWAARSPRKVKSLAETPTPFVIVHHGASRRCYTQEECIRVVKSYQNFHMDERHWDDIGYNFIIGEDGNAYTGRGWDNWGAHAPIYNNRSIGICIIGNFMNHIPNSKALDTLDQLITHGVQLGKIDSNYQLLGHRQSSRTLCPGDKLYNLLTTLPKWTSNPVDPFLSNDTMSTPIPITSSFSSPMDHNTNSTSKTKDLDPDWIK